MKKYTIYIVVFVLVILGYLSYTLSQRNIPATDFNEVKSYKIGFFALGDKDGEVAEKELEMTKILRRSAVVKRNMKAGELIKEEDITFKRPGTGIPPTKIHLLINKTLNKDKIANELILEEDFF